ncbi:MAG: sporulation protein YunB [Ruminococcaceae bacterium]|nr:sporulation protein YunB [Oscillospiraceae bacterium]
MKKRNTYIGKRKKALRRFAAYVLIVAAAVSLLFFYYEKRLQPITKTLALSRARSVAVNVSNETVLSVIEREGITYEDMITLEKDGAGRISALKTDIVKINTLKSKIASEIQSTLEKSDFPDIKIPIGSIIDGELLSGKGPVLKVSVLPAGTVSADIENVFSEAGINQTLHRIMLKICLSITVILPTERASADVVTSVCIAETVIVGEVPEAFTQVITPDEDIPGIINDFGAGQ